MHIAAGYLYSQGHLKAKKVSSGLYYDLRCLAGNGVFKKQHVICSFLCSWFNEQNLTENGETMPMPIIKVYE